MDTIFEVFTALNAAIDAGVMTQEILTVAVMNIAHRTAVDWKAGTGGATTTSRVRGDAAPRSALEGLYPGGPGGSVVSGTAKS